MNKIFVTAAAHVTESALAAARLGPRFGRLDLQSRLALLAVHSLGVNFETLARERIAIVLSADAGSLTTDLDFWNSRDAGGGPSPTLFAYTLPSAAVGEIAIQIKLTGPNLCFAGDAAQVLPAAAELIRRGEADACVCVSCNVVSPALAELTGANPSAEARAVFLQRAETGAHELTENDRDMLALCAVLPSQQIFPT